MVTLRKKTTNPLIKSTLSSQHKPYGQLGEPIVIRPLKGSKCGISKEWMHVCGVEETDGAYVVWHVKSWRSTGINLSNGFWGTLWGYMKAISMA
jgi:hypothetical protein